MVGERALRLTLFLAVFGVGSVSVAGQPQGGETKPKNRPVFARSLQNTLVFDHLNLRADADQPFALEVGDGDFFQIIVTRTDPRLFRYSISAVQEEQGQLEVASAATGIGVTGRTDGVANLTMRHDAHFGRYRVTIAVLATPGKTPQGKPDEAAVTPPSKPPTLGGHGEETPPAPAAPQLETGVLYPVSFDVWVRTRPQWKVSFSGGVAFSNLTDRKYYVKTDDAGKKTVEEDTGAKDQARHDIVAIANVYFDHQYWRSLMFGAAFGIGSNGSGTPRYFLGPSLVIGRNLIVSGGLSVGSVNALPNGQVLHQAPISGDNTLNSLGSQYRRGAYVTIAFAFLNRETEFTNAFSSSTTTAPAPVPAGPGTDDLKGDYVGEDGKPVATVATATAKGKTTVTVTMASDKSKVNLTETGVLEFSSADKKDRVKFSGSKDKVKIEYSRDGNLLFTGTKTTAKE